MAFDDFNESFNSRARDSFNSSTTTNANLNVGVENAGNTDNSWTDSGNVDLSADGSFTNDSHDTNSWTSGSGNSVENTLGVDASDNSVNGSYNEWLDESTNNSGNSFTWTRMDDHSTNVGNREYNTGFGGGVGGGDGRATIVDQSVNQNIDAFGVDQYSVSNAIVASGDGAIAAGDDVNITQSLNDSTNFTAVGGDVNLNNTTTIDTTIGSYNTAEDNSVVTDASQDWHVHDSYNDYSDNYEATNSFNDEIAISSDTAWDVDANVIWGSGLSGIDG